MAFEIKSEQRRVKGVQSKDGLGTLKSLDAIIGPSQFIHQLKGFPPLPSVTLMIISFPPLPIGHSANGETDTFTTSLSLLCLLCTGSPSSDCWFPCSDLWDDGRVCLECSSCTGQVFVVFLYISTASIENQRG